MCMLCNKTMTDANVAELTLVPLVSPAVRNTHKQLHQHTRSSAATLRWSAMFFVACCSSELCLQDSNLQSIAVLNEMKKPGNICLRGESCSKSAFNSAAPSSSIFSLLLLLFTMMVVLNSAKQRPSPHGSLLFPQNLMIAYIQSPFLILTG